MRDLEEKAESARDEWDELSSELSELRHKQKRDGVYDCTIIQNRSARKLCSSFKKYIHKYYKLLKRARDNYTYEKIKDPLLIAVDYFNFYFRPHHIELDNISPPIKQNLLGRLTRFSNSAS